MFTVFLTTLLIITSCGDPARSYTAYAGQKVYDGKHEFELEKVVDGLLSPVGMLHAGDGSGRLFVVSQSGQIYIVKGNTLQKEPFLDVSSYMVKMKNSYSEKGLLGAAFHPDYADNGRVFVYYSAPSDEGDHQSVIAEFKVSESNPDKVAPQQKVIMRVIQPESNHNGGNLAFGPDGLLYIGFGDGGGGGDKHGDIGNGQDISNVLGSIARIYVDGEAPYEIPKGNPFYYAAFGAPEIYAYGLRNPWRFSFDRKTGQLFCGDVGQNKYEEVNLVEIGQNYGWRAMEGYHIYDNNLYGQGPSGAFILPISEYDHEEGVSVIGGYVYRGTRYPELQGIYIFGDWLGKLYYLEMITENQWRRHFALLKSKKTHKTGFRIRSFGEDEAGEIYVVGQEKQGAKNESGVLYRLTLAK